MRTSAPFVRKIADVNAERKVITTWVNGSRHVKPGTTKKPHPSLYHVGVWYGAGALGGGCVTHWSKPVGGWERIILVLDPDRDHLFL